MPTTQLDATVRDASLADSSQIISGTAVGVGDVTTGVGTGGRKVWTEDELREAAETLVGTPVRALHSETEVGEVIDAGFVDGEGVVYEAEIKDSELADSIENGRLTVSIEARHTDGGRTDTRHGEAMVASNIRFDGMAIVQRGASPSASAQPGEAAALAVGMDALTAHAAEDDPASTEGDASDIEINDQTETALENKVDDHNEDAPEPKEVTLGMLKKVYRRGAGAWFSSNAGATQNQWAMARVNEFLEDLRNDRPLNDGNDNDLAPDGYEVAENAARNHPAGLAEVNGEEIDLDPPARVINAVEAGFEAKEEYADEIGDCGTGVGEAMGEAIVGGDLTPEIIVNGGDIASNGPATYLKSHAGDVDADGPPTDWSEAEWTGGCAEVQQALWGFYPDWFEGRKAEIEAAMEDTEMAASESGTEPEAELAEVPEAYRFDNPGEAVEAAQELGFGGEDTPADEIIHTHGEGDETVFMPGPTHEALVEALEERGELAESMNVGPIEFTGTKEGTMDETRLPNDLEGRRGHYLNPGETEDTSGYELVDADGNLRRGNLESAWNLRGAGDLGMPRETAERVLLNLGLVFGPPGSDANPLPEDAYEQAEERGLEIGTPHAAEAAASHQEVSAAPTPDDPQGEVFGPRADPTDPTDSTMTNDAHEAAILGSNLGEALSGKMQELMSNSEMDRADLVDAAATEADRDRSTINAIVRGDTECPPMDVLEGFAEALGTDPEMLVDAAARDGCEYSEMPQHHDQDASMAATEAGPTDPDTPTDSEMTDTTEEELRAELSEKDERIAELEEQIEQFEDERDDVAREYAEALAAHSEVLDADDYVERFEVAELAERYDDLNQASLAEEPEVRSGDGDGVEEEANLSAAERERKQDLESRLAELEDKEGPLAEKERNRVEAELAELPGGDA